MTTIQRINNREKQRELSFEGKKKTHTQEEAREKENIDVLTKGSKDSCRIIDRCSKETEKIIAQVQTNGQKYRQK